MQRDELLTALTEGVENGRIAPYLADFIAAELLDTDARTVGYDDRVRLDDTTVVIPARTPSTPRRSHR